MQTDPTLLANNTQHCWAQQCCDLLRPFAWNHDNVGTCCVKFETGQTFRPMQTDATLLANNTQQCWELLALVGSVCMGLKTGSIFEGTLVRGWELNRGNTVCRKGFKTEGHKAKWNET